jgi:hypothetical protein
MNELTSTGSDIWLTSLVEKYLESEGQTSVYPGPDMYDPEGLGVVVPDEEVDKSRWLFDNCETAAERLNVPS